MSCNFVVLLWYIVVVTPLSSVYRIMLVICDAFAGPDLAIKHILSYYLILSYSQNIKYISFRVLVDQIYFVPKNETYIVIPRVINLGPLKSSSYLHLHLHLWYWIVFTRKTKLWTIKQNADQFVSLLYKRRSDKAFLEHAAGNYINF